MVGTDTVQTLILLIGLIALAVMGCVRVGGAEAVWSISVDTDRIDLNENM